MSTTREQLPWTCVDPDIVLCADLQRLCVAHMMLSVM